MKYILTFVSGLSIMLIAVSCGGQSQQTGDGDGTSVVQMKVGSNTYNCLKVDGYYSDTYDCDYNHPLP